MSKNLLFLNTCREWGGGEKWTFETAEELAKRGYNVTVGSTPESELFQRADSAGIKTKKVPVSGSLSVLNPVKLLSFVNYLKKNEIDIIFLNLSQDLKFGAIAGNIAGVEHIIYRRGSAIPIKDRFYTEYLLGECVTDIIANSEATKETILENTSHWLTDEKIKIIYNGLKVKDIRDKLFISKTDIKNEFDIDSDDLVIANVGRLSPQKGHKYLLRAIKLIKEQIDSCKVLIVGKGELEEEIKAEAEKLDLKDKVIFTGFRKDIYNILSQSDFLLHTALWEGFGYVVAEAMAVGIPVVSTDVSNIAEIMRDGKSGYLCESENPDDIAEKALQMYRNSEAERMQMGQIGKTIIKNNFTFKKMIDKVEKEYLS